ncbi:hypothetical protein D9M68_584590 [compost metagenome]
MTAGLQELADLPFGQQVFKKGMDGPARVITAMHWHRWRDSMRAGQAQPGIIVDKAQGPLVEQAADLAVGVINVQPIGSVHDRLARLGATRTSRPSRSSMSNTFCSCSVGLPRSRSTT